MTCPVKPDDRELDRLAEIGHLKERVSELEQALAQAGDSIELQEAEQRGFIKGKGAALAPGYAIMPEEPTPAMYEAYKRAINDHIESLPGDQRAKVKGRAHGFRVKARIKFKARYRAMLDAFQRGCR